MVKPGEAAADLQAHAALEKTIYGVTHKSRPEAAQHGIIAPLAMGEQPRMTTRTLVCHRNWAAHRADHDAVARRIRDVQPVLSIREAQD
jgi:hypothetical protein